ncbi:alpha/beta fold hydrolase [Actinocatenispora rupis]|uniref:AB hydrolase-1 domain-containing protein n=1 Tax=Actinocatenispora rupis TaxID=519421 RepID=A0A8J3NC74_9ACTN|nr:alpha/beta hydrolase [Actinocatenispora rupis]GID11437.1 hypothetical protein Aru02nite_23260 [Actinocatenispora rupis]
MATDEPPIGRPYEVGGTRLVLHRAGEGGPAVVFLPGAGLVGLDFWAVHERAAARTTSVLYDRAGTGWSDPVDLPRGTDAVTDELRALLHTAGVPGPYVLVGHSLGGSYARRFAQRFGADVAGLLLVDPGYEDAMDHLPADVAEIFERMRRDRDAGTLPEPTAEQLAASRAPLAALYAEWPEPLRAALVEYHVRHWRTGLAEAANFEDVVHDELRRGGPLPDVPMTVLTCGGANPYWAQVMSPEAMRAALDGVRAGHAALAASVPRGVQRVLPDAHHQYVQAQQPDAIRDALDDLLARI